MYDTTSIPARNATSLLVRRPADGRKILGGYRAVTLYDARDPAHEALYGLPSSWGLSGLGGLGEHNARFDVRGKGLS